MNLGKVRKQKLYLAGPMTGLPNFGYPAFVHATRRLRGQGLTVLSPHERFMDETEEQKASRNYGFYLAHGLGLLKACEGIVLLRGWTGSRGARIELGLALDDGYSVYYYTPQEDFPLMELK